MASKKSKTPLLIAFGALAGIFAATLVAPLLGATMTLGICAALSLVVIGAAAAMVKNALDDNASHKRQMAALERGFGQ